MPETEFILQQRQGGCPFSSVTVEVPFLEVNSRVWELGESITYCIDVYECVCVFTYGRFNFSVDRHEGMSLLHHAAGEVADTSLLLSIIGVLYLQTHSVCDNITSCD